MAFRRSDDTQSHKLFLDKDGLTSCRVVFVIVSDVHFLFLLNMLYETTEPGKKKSSGKTEDVYILSLGEYIYIPLVFLKIDL